MSYKLAGVNWNDNGTIATKELTPLEALEKIDHTICLNNLDKNIKWDLDKYDHCDCKDFNEFTECYNAIETELKEKETPIETFEMFVGEPSEVICRKLRALEIIKEKMVDVAMILSCESADDYNRWCDSGASWSNEYIIQEEYELLKEVLE